MLYASKAGLVTGYVVDTAEQADDVHRVYTDFISLAESNDPGPEDLGRSQKRYDHFLSFSFISQNSNF